MDTRLADGAHHILDTLVAQLTLAGVDVPERRYVHTGEIAHDLVGEKCAEAFIVSWDAGFQGQIGFTGTGFPESTIRCAMPMSVAFTVALLRCVPTLRSGAKFPSQDDLDAAGTSLMEDAWTIASVIVDSTLNGALTTDHLLEFAIAGMAAVGPQGGVGGVAVNLFANIL